MICPSCDAEITPERKTETKRTLLRGEVVEYEDHFCRCPACNGEWGAEGFDFADQLYRTYRARYNMLRPEEIKAFRQGLGITQEELTSLLNWSPATINRYERGALQDKSHDTALKMAMTKEGLKTLLANNGSNIPEIKRLALHKKLG